MAKPEKRFKQGCCSATVFVNEIGKNGKRMLIRNIVIQKTYKDREGNWKNVNSFGVNELPKIALLATKAYDYLTTLNDEGE